MNPLEKYRELLKHGKLTFNSDQEAVLEYLAETHRRLVKNKKYLRILKLAVPPKGLYLWGGVGIGKTMIMDCFVESLPIPKLRLHLHAFMQRIHQELTRRQGCKNPLIIIATDLAKQYPVICFDEFVVTSVADAMIMVELFKTLFRHGVCLVATSNLPPQKLYETGLQRERFLPLIDLLEQNTQVWHLQLEQDYRKSVLEHIHDFYWPLSEQTEQSLYHAFIKLTGDSAITPEPLSLLERQVRVKLRSSTVIWFEFNDICGRPRSQTDYLALVQQFSTMIISDVPCLENISNDKVISFIHLIDILYDAKVKLIFSAAVPIQRLYTRGEFISAFQRTESRLFEMQSSLNYF